MMDLEKLRNLIGDYDALCRRVEEAGLLSYPEHCRLSTDSMGQIIATGPEIDGGVWDDPSTSMSEEVVIVDPAIFTMTDAELTAWREEREKAKIIKQRAWAESYVSEFLRRKA